jgi:hypothetical protein
VVICGAGKFVGGDGLGWLNWECLVPWGLGLVRVEGSGNGGTGSWVYSLALLLAELERRVIV